MLQPIDVRGIPKHILLQALFNAARVVVPTPAARVVGNLDNARAHRALDFFGANLVYLGGRILRIDLRASTIDPQFYNAANGEGLAESVVAHLRGEASRPVQAVRAGTPVWHYRVRLIGWQVATSADDHGGCLAHVDVHCESVEYTSLCLGRSASWSRSLWLYPRTLAAGGEEAISFTAQLKSAGLSPGHFFQAASNGLNSPNVQAAIWKFLEGGSNPGLILDHYEALAETPGFVKSESAYALNAGWRYADRILAIYCAGDELPANYWPRDSNDVLRYCCNEVLFSHRTLHDKPADLQPDSWLHCAHEHLAGETPLSVWQSEDFVDQWRVLRLVVKDAVAVLQRDAATMA